MKTEVLNLSEVNILFYGLETRGRHKKKFWSEPGTHWNPLFWFRPGTRNPLFGLRTGTRNPLEPVIYLKAGTRNPNIIDYHGFRPEPWNPEFSNFKICFSKSRIHSNKIHFKLNYKMPIPCMQANLEFPFFFISFLVS